MFHFNKYGNKRVKFDGFNFMSIFECKVYQHLKEFLPCVFEIKCQHRITVKPKTQNFPRMTYIADFAIFKDGKILLIVEAKGMMLEPFVIKMSFLEFSNPEIFKKIILVTRKGSKTEDYDRAKLPVLKLNHELPDFSFDANFKREFFNYFNKLQGL